MQRRDFLTTTLAAGITASVLETNANAAQSNAKKQLIEWRTYSVSSLENKEQLISVLDKALIPALNRQGIKPVGVFYTDAKTNDGKSDFDLNVFALIQYPSAAAFISAPEKLLADNQFVTDFAPVLKASVKEPIYTTMKSSLFSGFETCPAVEVPVSNPERLFQIRIYRSYNIERNASKVHMFDKGGELALFRKSGMNPVFFGECLCGDMQPNLTYMLGFENLTAKETGWKKFVASPEWQVIKADTQYKDTATEIVNIMLRPSNGSQV